MTEASGHLPSQPPISQFDDLIDRSHERVLELFKHAVGRAYRLRRVVIVDQINELALAPQRRRELHHKRVFAFIVRAFTEELHATFG